MTPTNVKESKRKEMFDYAFRLRRAICAISEKSLTAFRAVLDGFPRFISPSMAQGRGVDFPVTCRRHPGNPERTTERLTRAQALYFHVGNAVLAFYELCEDRPADALEARVRLLEVVAKYGLDQFLVEGDDATGYRLLPVHGKVTLELENKDVPNPQPLPV